MLFNETTEIIKRKELLSIEYVPETIVGREKEIKELAFNLSYFFRTNPTLPTLIIYGTVGTGKTTIINYVLKKFEESSKEKEKKIKIIRIKGSDSKTKYEVLKQILTQIAPDMPISTITADLHTKIVKALSERGLNVLIFLDEVHEIRENELNSVLYTISRLGEDIAYSKSKKGITKPQKSQFGYILVSNEFLLRNKLKDNTKSSLTRENLTFLRYNPKQIVEILKSRIDAGAIKKEVIGEGVLELIAGESVKEGEDSRYALKLLSAVCKEAEKRSLKKIDTPLVEEVSEDLKKNYLKENIKNLPDFYLEILLIIYELFKNDENINSKTIWDEYQKKTYLSKVNFSRISQIVSYLEKEGIIYVTTSKKTKLRNLSIEENKGEIEEVLKELEKL